MVKNKKIGVISLGCDKNRVDTEKMLAVLCRRHTPVNDINDADIVVINTCAFLAAARKEAIEEILSVAELKKTGKLEKIIVTGCLPQKFSKETFPALNEADIFLGVGDYENINEAIDKSYEKDGERYNLVGTCSVECGTDRVLTTSGYAYLKISEGCSNHCTYCLIPSIRGSFRSFPKEKLFEEAAKLGEVNELILVAQDLTGYGGDLTPKSNLTDLIRTLSPLNNVKGIRLLYCYPEGITDELIHEMQVNAKVIRYIDIPLQHASDRILKLMNRRGNYDFYLSLINKLKREVPGIAIRSTFITGFPTETDEDVETLIKFLNEAKLSSVGFFKYSKEEGTAAARLEGQIKQSVKTARLKKLYAAQKKIVKQTGKSLIGKMFKVVAEGFDENMLAYFGRAYMHAPDVDGKVYFFSEDEVEYGKFYNVKIIKSDGYDLYGERI
ncbi:MAG: 30S ribosomal protein S12 methylthiotransferase RimO [Clostridia bacterium]|nr:30S ribosomal protein S12 methylthiotransferase RimO [Clostridia bacterium]